MDKEDKGDDNEDNEDNEDDANHSERDLQGEVADELKEEEDGNKSCLSPNRRDDEEEEEEEEQQSPPQTTNNDVDPDAADAPKTSTDDDSPNAAQAPPVCGKKDPHKMMRLNHKGNPSEFRRIAPVKVPRFAKRPAKRQAEEINSDQKAKKARKSSQDPAADKRRMGLVYLDANGNGKVFIPLMAGTLLGPTVGRTSSLHYYYLAFVVLTHY
jgi:hypothetical protein